MGVLNPGQFKFGVGQLLLKPGANDIDLRLRALREEMVRGGFDRLVGFAEIERCFSRQGDGVVGGASGPLRARGANFDLAWINSVNRGVLLHGNIDEALVQCSHGGICRHDGNAAAILPGVGAQANDRRIVVRLWSEDRHRKA